MEDRASNGPYSVVESEIFLAQVAGIIGNVERWDEIKWSGDWALERNPRVGQYIADDDSWAMQFRTIPPIVVFYKINEEMRQVIPLEVFRL